MFEWNNSGNNRQFCFLLTNENYVAKYYDTEMNDLTRKFTIDRHLYAKLNSLQSVSSVIVLLSINQIRMLNTGMTEKYRSRCVIHLIDSVRT